MVGNWCKKIRLFDFLTLKNPKKKQKIREQRTIKKEKFANLFCLTKKRAMFAGPEQRGVRGQRSECR